MTNEQREHGYRETYEDHLTKRSVTRVWFQPHPQGFGRWLTLSEWDRMLQEVNAIRQRARKREDPPAAKILPDDVLRMCSERKALKSLIEGLSAFLNGPKLATLTPQKQMLLGAQLNAMRTYHDVLSLRIELECNPE